MQEHVWIAVEWVLSQKWSTDDKAEYLRRIGEVAEAEK